MGSPPRMRGKGPQRGPWRGAPGITPAYAGKSFQPFFHPPRWRDHPRVCGEKPVAMHTRMTSAGSPPRMRGKALPKRSKAMKHGITPAYAGKRLCYSLCLPPLWDHPRVCGEKVIPCTPGLHIQGSPPRMRGKGRPGRLRVWLARITPAYAGKRLCYSLCLPPLWDHPRVCGEKVIPCTPGLHIQGSPPRMRGKGRPGRLRVWLARITPAYAGKSR